jgi:hypothetical protein
LLHPSAVGKDWPAAVSYIDIRNTFRRELTSVDIC